MHGGLNSVDGELKSVNGDYVVCDTKHDAACYVQSTNKFYISKEKLPSGKYIWILGLPPLVLYVAPCSGISEVRDTYLDRVTYNLKSSCSATCIVIRFDSL